MEENFRVPVTKIKALNDLPNSNNLAIATVFDFNVVVRRHQYKINDSVIYIPIDSVLPNKLEEKIFGTESKIKLNKGRVKQIRIRKFPSQGMLVDPSDTELADLEEGQNVAELLGVTKYEPEVSTHEANQPRTKKERNRSWENPYMHEYGGLLNAKWYPDLFEEGQEVVYQEKIHGTNARAGLLPYTPKTLWQKLLKFLKLAPDFQFTYGSNKVQLQAKSYTGYYEDNVYAEACKKYGIQNKLKPHETVYFEIYGDGVQKDYSYGCKKGEHRIVVFDVKVLAEDCKSTQWLTTSELAKWCQDRGLPMVPVVYQGPHSKEAAKKATEGPSLLGGQPIREGIVIKDPKETTSFIGKKYLKLLSDAYLDLDGTDFH